MDGRTPTGRPARPGAATGERGGTGEWGGTGERGWPRPGQVVVLWSACLVVVALGVRLAVVTSGFFAPLFVGAAVVALLSALLRPLFHRLRRMGVPPSPAALVCLLAPPALLTVPLAPLLRATRAQLAQVPAQISSASEHLSDVLAGYGVAGASALVSDIGPDRMPGPVGAVTPTVVELHAWAVLAVTVPLVLVGLFFVLRDGPALAHRAARGIGLPATAVAAGRAAWATLAAHVRAVLLHATGHAVVLAAVLTLLGVPLALGLAAAVFLAAFVPVVGVAVAGFLATVVALTVSPLAAVATVLAVTAAQLLLTLVLRPRLVPDQVRLHPAVGLVTVVAGLLVGGVPGGVLAVPLVAAGVRAAARYGRSQKSGPIGSG